VGIHWKTNQALRHLIGKSTMLYGSAGLIPSTTAISEEEEWALKFAGLPETPQLVQCPLWTAKNTGVTYAFWIKSNRETSAYASPSECILYNGAFNIPLSDGYGIYWGWGPTYPQRLIFYQTTVAAYLISFDITFTKWTHIATVLIDADPNIRIQTYVDGVLNRDRSDIPKGTLPTTRSLYGATDEYVAQFIHPLRENVWLDEIRVWEKTLSADEVKADMLAATPDPQNLVAWYPLNEGKGTVAKDNSGQNKDGTISGAAWAQR